VDAIEAFISSEPETEPETLPDALKLEFKAPDACSVAFMEDAEETEAEILAEDSIFPLKSDTELILAEMSTRPAILPDNVEEELQLAEISAEAVKVPETFPVPDMLAMNSLSA